MHRRKEPPLPPPPLHTPPSNRSQEYSNIPCNNACCGGFTYCANTEFSTCCFDGEVALVDPDGLDAICCSPGQFNPGHICCNQGTEFCGGYCCPGTCTWLESNPGSPTCVATSAGCKANGGTGSVCGSGGSCPAGQYCNELCCFEEVIIP